MNMETIAALGLLGKMTNSSVTVNTASGQNMGVAGDVYVMFKIIRNIHLLIDLQCVNISADLLF